MQVISQSGDWEGESGGGVAGAGLSAGVIIIYHTIQIPILFATYDIVFTN